MATFEKFSDRNHTTTLQQDITTARGPLMMCVNQLVLGPGGPSPAMQQLLSDAFDVPVGEWQGGNPPWDKLSDIRSNLLSCSNDLGQLTYEFDPTPPSPNEMEFAAYTRSDRPRRIFVRREYFAGTGGSQVVIGGGVATVVSAPCTAKQRQAILVHEYIHLVYPNAGHPGGQKLMMQRGRVGIPYREAVRNPYCYQYFYEWL